MGVSYGAKELTCKISSKSGEKHGSYGSSKKIGTRDSSRIRDKEQKTQNGPNRKILFFKIFNKIFGPDRFNGVQGHQKNSFYRNHITDVTMKIIENDPNFCRIFRFLAEMSAFYLKT